MRSNSFNSQEPKIMILRRPSEEKISNGNASNKSKNPVKSLQQVNFLDKIYRKFNIKILVFSAKQSMQKPDLEF